MSAFSVRPGGTLIFAAIAALGAAGVRAQGPAPLSDRALESLADDPATGSLLAELRGDFPDDWRTFKGTIVAMAKAGAPAERIEARTHDLIGQIAVAHRADVAAAPPAALVPLARAKAAVIRALSEENVRDCAAYGLNRLPRSARPSPATSNLMTLETIAYLKAARAGMDHPTAPEEVTDEDVGRLTDGMKALKVKPTLVRSLISGGIAGASAANQCAAGVGMFQAIADMNVHAAARWTRRLYVEPDPADARKAPEG
ncbi:MAG: hypothetical protein ABI376_06180 [Caulobacteraceae bacterium]